MTDTTPLSAEDIGTADEALPWDQFYARLAEQWGTILDAADKAENASAEEVIEALRAQWRHKVPAPAVRAAARFVEESITPRRCDSEAVANCWRCTTVFLSRTLIAAIEGADATPPPPDALREAAQAVLDDAGDLDGDLIPVDPAALVRMAAALAPHADTPAAALRALAAKLRERAATPKRIQRQRTRGWRMPDGAAYVGRPTVYGNPYRVGDDWLGRPMTHKEAAQRYGQLLAQGLSPEFAARVEDLRGRDLACWCPLDQPCHADALLELANR